MFVLGMYIITRGGYGWLALELFRQITEGDATDMCMQSYDSSKWSEVVSLSSLVK